MIVLDTNVIVSGLLFPGGPPDKIVRAILSGSFQNATSPDLLTELRRILKKKFVLSDERLDSLIGLIGEASLLVYPPERLKIITKDDADNRVLECAVTAKADRIVTGDAKHLLKLKNYRGIPIQSPVQFLEKVGLV